MDKMDCGEIIRKRYIKFLNLMIAIDYNEEHKVIYYQQLENAYRLGLQEQALNTLLYIMNGTKKIRY